MRGGFRIGPKIGGLSTRPKAPAESDSLTPFSAPVRRWFESSFEAPTPAQAGGWKAIAGGANALICAPTGSGKTLAAFLWGIDKLSRSTPIGGPDSGDIGPKSAHRRGNGVKLVYVLLSLIHI